MTPAVDRSPAGVWLAWFLRCLTAAWVATAGLYALTIGTLPEPVVGLATAVVVAAVVAAALVNARLAPVTAAAPPPAPPPPPDRGDAPWPPPPDPGPALEWSTYSRTEGDLRQCPRCGSFAVTVSDGGPHRSNTCSTCDQAWQSGPGLPDPDVAVRSWLHH